MTDCGIWTSTGWIHPTQDAPTDEIPPEELGGLVEQSDPERCDTSEIEAAAAEALLQGED